MHELLVLDAEADLVGDRLRVARDGGRVARRHLVAQRQRLDERRKDARPGATRAASCGPRAPSRAPWRAASRGSASGRRAARRPAPTARRARRRGTCRMIATASSGGRDLGRDHRDEPLGHDVLETALVGRRVGDRDQAEVEEVGDDEDARRPAAATVKLEPARPGSSARTMSPPTRGNAMKTGTSSTRVLQRAGLTRHEREGASIRPITAATAGPTSTMATTSARNDAREGQRAAATRTRACRVITAVPASRTTRPNGCQSAARLVATMPATHAAARHGRPCINHLLKAGGHVRKIGNCAEMLRILCGR